MLSNWEGFWDTVEGLFINPSNTLQWLDLSFNDIKTIDQVSNSASRVELDRICNCMFMSKEPLCLLL